MLNEDRKENIKKLFYLVQLSKNKKTFKIAAANAITILNKARANFCGKNLEKINIEGADLSHGIFYETNFSKANLSGVNFCNSYLTKAIFDGAVMQNTMFHKLNK